MKGSMLLSFLAVLLIITLMVALRSESWLLSSCSNEMEEQLPTLSAAKSEERLKRQLATPFKVKNEERHYLLSASSIEHANHPNEPHGHSYLVKSSKPFFMCNAPKTGCTAWKYFIYFANLNDKEPFSIRAREEPGWIHTAIDDVNLTAFKNGDLFASLDRFVVARNPYVRFISSYLDWKNRAPRKKEVSFREFIDLYKVRSSALEPVLWDHIDPVSKACGYEDIGYTSFLRVEEQSLWIDALLDEYNLTETMNQYLHTGNTVFENNLKFESTIQSNIASVIGAKPWPGKTPESAHHHGGSNAVMQYYTSRDLVNDVTALMLVDFVHFSYPVWDGNPNSFRFV